MERTLRNNIKKLKEIYCSYSNPTKSIYIEIFRKDDPDSTFEKLFTYNYKAYDHNRSRNAEFPIPRAYPYQLDIVNSHFRESVAKRSDLIQAELKKYDCDINQFLENASLDLSVIDQ